MESMLLDLDLPTNFAVNAEVAESLRALADKIEASEDTVAGLAMVVVYSDHCVGTGFNGEDYVRLLGGVDVVKDRILAHFRRD